MALIGHILTVLVATILVTSPEAKTLNRRAATSDPNPNVRQLFTDIGGRQKVDLVVAMDRSKSISEEVFYLKIKKLARAILTQHATLDTDYVRLAVISFAVNATTHFDYISNPDSAKTKCELFNDPESKWHDILYSTGEAETNIKAAFEKSLVIFEEGKKHRDDPRQIILLITDGKYTDNNDPIEVSRQLKEGSEVTIYGAGVGVWLEIGNVRALTTLTAGSDLYSHYDDWKNYVTSGDNLTSYGKDLGQTWSRNYAETCTGSCMANAQCYCDIDRGVDECLCQGGYAWINDSCTECPANTYKAGPGNQAQCSPCPPGTTSLAGARSSSECVCGGANCSDPCESSPCGGNQLCMATSASDYECQCVAGWTGAACAVNEDACLTAACGTGSVCVDGVGPDVYACVCTDWTYTGVHCTVNEDECEPGLCKNNATCADRDNNFQCVCEGDFVGRYCQDERAETPAPTPAPNPTRPTNPGGQTTSPSVTNAPVTADDNLLWIIIGAACGGGLLLLIIIVAVSCAVCRKRKDADQSEKQEVKNIARQFSGFWKKKTVRGNKWMDEENDGGLPSAPVRPDLLSDTSTIQGSVENLKTDEYTELPYQTMTMKTGMESWQNYITELADGGVIERAVVTKTAGDKTAQTSAWLYDSAEVERVAAVMDEQESGVPVLVQDGEYCIHDNDGTLAAGRTIGDVQEARSVCIGRTKTYVIMAIAGPHHDQGKVRKEVQWIVDHISGEGY